MHNGLLAALLPHPVTALALAALGAMLAFVMGRLGGTLAMERHWPRAYTRKLFHFAIFTAAMPVHLWGGWPAVNAYGAGITLVVLAAVWRGHGHPPYETLARERDVPHQTFYILVPMATTLLGGLTANALAGIYAVVGYLVTGWADAAAEPVGRRWGRHPYRVPVLAPVECTRTLEGSAAVFVFGWLAAATALALLGHDAGVVLGVGLIIALVTVVVEAASPHGSDNFTTMVAAALLARWLAG